MNYVWIVVIEFLGKTGDILICAFFEVDFPRYIYVTL